jgi:hypothetical protein
VFFTISRDGGNNWDNLPLTRNLSNSDGEAFGPAIAITSGGVNRAFVVYHGKQGGRTQVYMIRSKKSAKFKRPFSITPGMGSAFAPRIAVDSNEAINVVWLDTSGALPRVAFVRSTDSAATFSAPLDVSRSAGGAIDPDIALDPGGAINVVWEDSASGSGQIMFARSVDGGQTFTEPVLVSTGQSKATEAHVAIDSLGRIYVSWIGWNNEDLQAFLSRSTDGGRSFSVPINVSNNPDGRTHKPVLAASGNIVYLSYQNGDIFFQGEIQRHAQVFLVKSEDAGLSFSDSVQVSNADNSRGRAHSPAMAFDSTGRLHVVWIDTTPIGQDEGILVYANTDNGRRFSTKKIIVAAL